MYGEKAQAHNYFESARDIKLFASKSSDVVETTQLRGYVPGGCEFHESEIVILCIEVIWNTQEVERRPRKGISSLATELKNQGNRTLKIIYCQR